MNEWITQSQQGYGTETSIGSRMGARQRQGHKSKARRRSRQKSLWNSRTGFFLIFLITLGGVAMAYGYSDNDGAIANPIEYTSQSNGGAVPDNRREERAALLTLSANHPMATDIAAHMNEIDSRLLELAIRNPETLEFVLGSLEKSGADTVIDISSEYTPGEIPHFLQWDSRWGYGTYYNGHMMALAGCGPTALSMVAVGLTGDASLNPMAVAEYSAQNGYVEESGATRWAFMTEAAAHFGLSVREVPLDESAIVNALALGKPIIMSVKPGDFTDSGHFIVLTGVTPEGEIRIHDPNSVIRTQKLWDISVFMEQAKVLWAYEALE